MSATTPASYNTMIDAPLRQLAVIVKGLHTTLEAVLDVAERYEKEHQGVLDVAYAEDTLTDENLAALEAETGYSGFYDAVAELVELAGVVERSSIEASNRRHDLRRQQN